MTKIIFSSWVLPDGDMWKTAVICNDSFLNIFCLMWSHDRLMAPAGSGVIAIVSSAHTELRSNRTRRLLSPRPKTGRIQEVEGGLREDAMISLLTQLSLRRLASHWTTGVRFPVGVLELPHCTTVSRSTRGSTRSHIQWIPSTLCPGLSGRSLKLIIHLYLIPRLYTFLTRFWNIILVSALWYSAHLPRMKDTRNVRRPFAKFVDSLRVRTLWRCDDGLFFEVPHLASEALLTALHPILDIVLQTFDHFEISCLEAPFSWLEKLRNRMGRARSGL
jgi:hypothetical protein